MGDSRAGTTGGDNNRTLSLSNLPSHIHTSGSFSATPGGSSHRHVYVYPLLRDRHSPNPDIENSNPGVVTYSDTSNTTANNTNNDGAHSHDVSGNSVKIYQIH